MPRPWGLPPNIYLAMLPSILPNSAKLRKFVILSFLIVGISLLSMLAPVPSIASQPLSIDKNALVPPSGRQPVITFDVEVLAADPMERTLTLDWYPQTVAFDCKRSSAYGIYMSPDIVDASSPNWSATPPYPPLMQLNASDSCGDTSIFTSSPTFRTVTKLLASAPQRLMELHTLGQSSLQDYPFDVYLAPMEIWVIDQLTGEMSAPAIARTSGIAVNFEVSISQVAPYHGLNTAQTQLSVTFQVERSIATKVFVVMIAVTNWLTASTFTIMCAAAIIYRPHKIYSEMFVLPVGVVFAFASIRQNMPGAPDGFGTTLDMYSTLPFLVIMTFSGLTLILLVLYRRIKEHCSPEELVRRQDLEPTGNITTISLASKMAETASSNAPERGHIPSSRASTNGTFVANPGPDMRNPSDLRGLITQRSVDGDYDGKDMSAWALRGCVLDPSFTTTCRDYRPQT